MYSFLRKEKSNSPYSRNHKKVLYIEVSEKGVNSGKIVVQQLNQIELGDTDRVVFTGWPHIFTARSFQIM